PAPDRPQTRTNWKPNGRTVRRSWAGSACLAASWAGRICARGQSSATTCCGPWATTRRYASWIASRAMTARSGTAPTVWTPGPTCRSRSVISTIHWFVCRGCRTHPPRPIVALRPCATPLPTGRRQHSLQLLEQQLGLRRFARLSRHRLQRGQVCLGLGRRRNAGLRVYLTDGNLVAHDRQQIVQVKRLGEDAGGLEVGALCLRVQ